MNPTTKKKINKESINHLCKGCKKKCKQTSKVVVVKCPQHEKA